MSFLVNTSRKHQNPVQERIWDENRQLINKGRRTSDYDRETLPQKQEEAITKYCDQIFNSGAETEEFFYRLGLRDGMKLRKNVKMVLKQLSE